MVNIDLDIKGLIGLADSGSIKKEKLKEYLEKFDKKDFINYIMDDLVEEETDDTDEDIDI